MKTCITNGKLVLKDRIVSKNIYFENGIITEISHRQPTNEVIINAMGNYVAPGFVDVHSHGRNGSDTMYPTFKDINNISTSSMLSGVTTILPTTMTMSVEATAAAIENVAAAMGKVEGSKIAGVHMEGPFFNLAYKGAQPAKYMIAPTIENYRKLTGNHEDIVRKISLAPELDGCLSLIEYLVSNNVSVSMGHTNATYEQAHVAIETGANSATHTYNAMTPLTHRNPGVVGAVLESDSVFGELILDGIHVAYPAVKVLINAKGCDRVMLITDSLEAASLPDGTYSLGGQPVTVKDGAARLASGTLAGSITSMNASVYKAYHHLGLPLYDAVTMASYAPAQSLNLQNIGKLAVNYLADIVIFDEDIIIKNVFIDGIMKVGKA